MKATNRSPLPATDAPETPALKAFYLQATTAELDALAKSFGYSTRRSFMGAMRERYGVQRLSPTPRFDSVFFDGAKNMEEPQILIPPIEIKKYKPSKTKDPETQVLLLGDLHFGQITPTYNIEIAKKRMATLFNSLMVITECHRKSIAINDIVVIGLGDMVHGENPFQGAKLEGVACGALSQVYEVALPEMLSLLCSLKENFRSVKFYGVQGNHGRISKEAPATSNWDNALYKTMAGWQKPEGIEVYPPTTFHQLVDINEHRFFCYHGDQIQISNGIPYFAQRRKLNSWYMNYPYDYACQGHFHEDDMLAISGKTTLFCNGSLVSDDPFALEKLGLSTIPVQKTFGVHKKIGLTWANRIVVDFNYVKGGKDGS